MQKPIVLDPMPGLRHESSGDFGSPPEWLLSVESRVKLRELCGYIDNARAILSEIRASLSMGESSFEVAASLQRASKRLESFYLEADSWGFDALYEVAQGLQMLLLNSASRAQTDELRQTVKRGLAMLSALLEQCERDFCWRLATADMLDYLNQAATN